MSINPPSPDGSTVFGYTNQTHAHNYYPAFLWRNTEKVPLKNEVHPPANANAAIILRILSPDARYSVASDCRRSRW